MIVHLLSGHNISVVVEENEKVSIVKKRIQQILGRPYEKISLVHEGTILDDDNIISYYRITVPYVLLLDLTNDSTVTAVNPPHPTYVSLEEQEKQVEEYLISMCSNLKPTQQNEQESPAPSMDDSVKILSELADKTNPCCNLEVEEIVKRLLGKDELLTTWAESDFFGAVIEKTDIVRDVVLSHPLIAELIALNPGLQEFVENDENIKSIVEIMKSPNKEESIHKRRKIRQLIEKKLGKQLTLSPRHLQFMKDCRERKVKPVQHNSQSKKIVCSERQLKALYTISSTHPELIVKFLKSTPIYRYLIHKNPKLLEKIITPEQIKLFFSPNSLHSVIQINEEISQD